MNEIEGFMKEEERAMAEKRKHATINGIPVSDRYLSIGGEPVWKWELTVHATEGQLYMLKIFFECGGNKV